MLNKSEKKVVLVKILAVLIGVALFALAVVRPTTPVQHVEKPFTVSANAQ